MKQLIFMMLMFVGATASAQLYINEVMASNREGIYDDFFERDDWIEIYNSGGIQNLAGYYLSDRADSLDLWQFPSTNAGLTTVLPNNHLLVWVDNDPEQGEDHTNFKLSGDGETIYLVMPDGETIVDQITYPAQARDISYGRSCDGCNDWVFFNNSTPDDENMELDMPTMSLFINEVQFENDSYIADPSGDFDSWIEIYNPNISQVDLSGYSIERESDGAVWEIPDTNPVLTAVRAQRFIVLWADGEANEGSNHLDFTIGAADVLTLRGPDGTVSDTFEYYPHPVNQSCGREDDGSPGWTVFTIPTPRVSNDLVFVEPEPLFINELMSDNETDTLDNAGQFEDWWEVYNPNNYPVDLAGYYFTDNPENTNKWQVPTDAGDSTIVPANGYLLFWADEDGSQGWNHANFRLSNEGEQLLMFSPDAFTLADRIDFGLIPDDQSYGRETDGADAWVNFINTTPEYTNNGASINIVERSLNASMIYPNPAIQGDYVFFNGFRDVVLYGMDGRLLGSYDSVDRISTNRLKRGGYMLRFGDGTSQRLVVR